MKSFISMPANHQQEVSKQISLSTRTIISRASFIVTTCEHRTLNSREKHFTWQQSRQ
ncbi:unnamed protein product [Musa hybrid cultivar]